MARGCPASCGLPRRMSTWPRRPWLPGARGQAPVGTATERGRRGHKQHYTYIVSATTYFVEVKKELDTSHVLFLDIEATPFHLASGNLFLFFFL
jgi:hypothetical protein